MAEEKEAGGKAADIYVGVVGVGCRHRLLRANPHVSVEVHGFAREAFGSGLLFDDRPKQGEGVGGPTANP